MEQSQQSKILILNRSYFESRAKKLITENDVKKALFNFWINYRVVRGAIRNNDIAVKNLIEKSKLWIEN